jgi:site-specific DNA-methyltransferase (adenine-specific)
MIFRDHHQNFRQYHIPKAQLIIADIPYNLGNKAYASNPAWYTDGDNANGESALAGKDFFMTDNNFKPAEFMHFCSKMLKPEPVSTKKEKIEGEKTKREKSNAPAMIVFCAFNQMYDVAELGKKHGLNNYIPLIFRKKFSAQVLKANMKIVGNCEYGVLLYRDKLPKFNNNGKMVMNCIEWVEDEDINNYPKLHPTQKPVGLLKRLIELFTDVGEVVIDPCAGSGSSLVAAIELNRKAYGFEIDKEFYPKAKDWIERTIQRKKDIDQYGFAKTEMDNAEVNLFTDY